MNKRPRRQITPQMKVEILKRHLVDKEAISALCDEYQIQPTQFYQWQKQLFASGEKAFEKKNKPTRNKKSEENLISKLEAKLTQKNEVVAELLEEHVKLKKELGEL